MWKSLCVGQLRILLNNRERRHDKGSIVLKEPNELIEPDCKSSGRHGQGISQNWKFQDDIRVGGERKKKRKEVNLIRKQTLCELVHSVKAFPAYP